MSELNRLWTKIARFFEALEGMDDPIGDYMFSLRKRVERIERDLDYLKRQLHSHPGGSAIPDHANG
jgi:hypothetical protein